MPVAPKHLKPRKPGHACVALVDVAARAASSLVRAGQVGRGHAIRNRSPLTSLGDRDRKSVAILPFKNVGNDREIDFYQFSLADAVITELARVRSLVVRPSSVIVKYQNKTVDAAEAGRELASTRFSPRRFCAPATVCA